MKTQEEKICECGICGLIVKPGNRFINGHQQRGIHNGRHSDFDHSESTTRKEKLWREAVLERDGYICQSYFHNKEYNRLDAHHIETREDRPDLIWTIANGITLCVSCHREKHPPSMETKTKMGNAKLGSLNPRFGKPGIKSMLGKNHREDTKQKQSVAKKGKHPNNFGKKDSIVARNNKRIAQLKRWKKARQKSNVSLMGV